jgi:alpha-D-ribose 1-methylphosphonate 5-triphosphate synthase subunit PhnH
VLRGFAEPMLDAQRAFRSALDAMAQPGRLVALPPPVGVPAPLDPAAAALCLALVDGDTPLWLDAAAAKPAVKDYVRFHCGVPLTVEPAGARFALITAPATMPSLDAFDPGSDEAPERSATLIVQVTRLSALSGRRLSGPGIPTERWLDVIGVPDHVWQQRRDGPRFPRGLDLFLTAGRVAVALPRTTRVDD